MAPPNSKPSNFQSAARTLKRKASDEEGPSRRNKPQNHSSDHMTSLRQSVPKGKSQRLTLKQPKSHRQNSGDRGRPSNKNVKLGNYDVVGPNDQYHHGRSGDHYQPSHDHPQDRTRSDRPSHGHEFRSDSHCRPADLRMNSDNGPPRGPLWCVDLGGDDDNVRYGRNNKWEVPRYYPTAGQGSILGLDPAVKIDRVQSTDTYYVLKYPAKVARARFEAVVDEEREGDVSKDDDGEEVDDEPEGLEDEVERSFQEVIYEPEKHALPIVTPKG